MTRFDSLKENPDAVALVLPRQGSLLVNRNVSYWEVGKFTGINPLRSRTIPIEELDGHVATVRLRKLANQLENQEYEVSLYSVALGCDPFKTY